MDIEIDKKSTAIVVIDLQKGIVSMPTEPYSVDIITNNAVKLVQAFRKYNMPVFLVHVGMSADFKDALQPKNDQLMQSRSQMASDWTEFITELGPEKQILLLTKDNGVLFTAQN